MFRDKMTAIPFFLALFLAGCAEPPPPPPKHIGILLHGESRVPLMNGFLDEMNALGYEVGKNVLVTTRNTNNDLKQLVPLTKQLVEQKVDLLVAAGGLEAEEIKAQIDAMQAQTPVLVLYINAIMERRFVVDRRNPGWNVTGIDNLNGELSGKRVELMKGLLPNLKKYWCCTTRRSRPQQLG